jgi:hypothetical protein
MTAGKKKQSKAPVQKSLRLEKRKFTSNPTAKLFRPKPHTYKTGAKSGPRQHLVATRFFFSIACVMLACDAILGKVDAVKLVLPVRHDGNQSEGWQCVQLIGDCPDRLAWLAFHCQGENRTVTDVAVQLTPPESQACFLGCPSHQSIFFSARCQNATSEPDWQSQYLYSRTGCAEPTAVITPAANNRSTELHVHWPRDPVGGQARSHTWLAWPTHMFQIHDQQSVDFEVFWLSPDDPDVVVRQFDSHYDSCPLYRWTMVNPLRGSRRDWQPTTNPGQDDAQADMRLPAVQPAGWLLTAAEIGFAVAWVLVNQAYQRQPDSEFEDKVPGRSAKYYCRLLLLTLFGTAEMTVGFCIAYFDSHKLFEVVLIANIMWLASFLIPGLVRMLAFSATYRHPSAEWFTRTQHLILANGLSAALSFVVSIV